MNKKQLEYVKEQLDIMAEEIEAIKDVADRAEIRGQYIQLFIDMCAVSNNVDVAHENPSDALVNDKAKPEPVVEEVEEEELVDEDSMEEEVEEVVEEPEHVTAETKAVLPQEEEEVLEEDPLADAEIVKVVLNDEDEKVDITEMYSVLIKDGVDEEDAGMVGLFVTEYGAINAYVEKFNYMQHGLARAYAAYLATSLSEADLLQHIENFSTVKVASPEEFIDDENAEALFDFICQ
jgi:hypothetical protein